jgi:predicted ArsR family transcriptional regulator
MVLSLVAVSRPVDPIDEVILTALQDGNPAVFSQLLDRSRVSHNTLRLHLEKLVEQGLVAREKTRVAELGRPKFAYVVPTRVRRQVSSALSDPFIEIVSLPFSRLRHMCRFEKGGYCKQLRKECEAQDCPEIKK